MSKRRMAAARFFFFLFGAIVHFLCWRGFVILLYTGQPVETRSLVDAHWNNTAITIIGGLSACYFSTKLLRGVLTQSDLRPAQAMLKSGVYGMLATFCAFEAFY